MTKLDTDFQHLLYEISNRLVEEDVNSIKFILASNKNIPSQDLETTKNGKDIFALMERYGLLSATKTDELIQTLKTMKLEPCFTLIEDFNRNNNEALAKAKEGPCNIKEDMVVEHFMETSKLKELEEKMATTKFITLSDNEALMEKRTTVAFSAYTTNPQAITSNTNIKFEKVWTNIGNGYNPSTGIFTALRQGVYHITAVVMSDGDQMLFLHLIHNNKYTAGSNLTGDGRKTGTFDVVLNLQKGDKVSVGSVSS